MATTPSRGHSSSGPFAANASDTRLDAQRLRNLIVISFSASVAFAAMYSTQPILPQISQEFHASPAEAGLTLLAVTFALAVASLGAGRWPHGGCYWDASHDADLRDIAQRLQCGGAAGANIRVAGGAARGPGAGGSGDYYRGASVSAQ